MCRGLRDTSTVIVIWADGIIYCVSKVYIVFVLLNHKWYFPGSAPQHSKVQWFCQLLCFWCRQQLVEVLGQAMADEVITLRAGSSSEAPKTQPVADTAPLQPSSPAAISKASDAQVSQAAAEDLHLQADAAIPAGSQLAESLARVSSDDEAASQKGGTASAVGSTAADLHVRAESDQQDPPADSSTAEGAEGQVAPEAPEATSSSPAAAAGRMPPRGVTVLRSDPRFASKPINPAVNTDSSEISGRAGGSPGSNVACCIWTLSSDGSM